MKRNLAILTGLTLSCALTLGACSDSGIPTSSLENDGGSSSLSREGSHTVTPGRYIVVFRNDVSDPRAETDRLSKSGETGKPVAVYEHALKGFVVDDLPDAAVAVLESDPHVAYVQPDYEYQLSHITPTGIRRVFADANASLDIDAYDDYRVDVDVAILDTGIDFDHPDLNVVGGIDCLTLSGKGKNQSAICVAGGDDDSYVGHGTHVAGTVAAIDNKIGVVGIAPGARLWALKAFDRIGRGATASIVAALDWVAANADVIEVVNMSFGGSGTDRAMSDAIQAAVNLGVAFAASAGNSDADAGGFSPASFSTVLTVSALADFDGKAGGAGSPSCLDDQDDTLADFSNWGSSVDVTAPGVCILSTLPGGDYGLLSGTSMAAPHATGALALLASANKPRNAGDVANLYAQVIAAGNLDWTDDSGDGIKEPLLDVRNSAVFKPAMVPGKGRGNSTLSITLELPADGAKFASGESIPFAAHAHDEDRYYTDAIIWTSNVDGVISTGGSFSAVLSDGTHRIKASVSDGLGNTAEDSVAIAVGTVITLTAVVRKVKRSYFLDLTWSGATSADVDLYHWRNGSPPSNPSITIENDGFYTYDDTFNGGGFENFKICEAGTQVCSSSLTVYY